MSTGIVQVADRTWQIAVVPYVNVFAIRDEDGVTLVDTAIKLRADSLIGKLATLGIRPGDVTRTLLTHCHPDHAGGAARLIERGVSREVLVGPGDLQTVRGEAPQPPRDPSTLGGRIVERIGGGKPGIPPVTSATAIEDGTELPIGGGCVAVATPGHTPGHTAFHLTSRGLLIGGDVVFNVFKLRPSPGFFCSDIAANRDSILRLAECEPSTVALAHGDPISDDPAGKLRELVS